jgi:hypothetical protein
MCLLIFMTKKLISVDICAFFGGRGFNCMKFLFSNIARSRYSCIDDRFFQHHKLYSKNTSLWKIFEMNGIIMQFIHISELKISLSIFCIFLWVQLMQKVTLDLCVAHHYQSLIKEQTFGPKINKKISILFPYWWFPHISLQLSGI